MNKQFKDLAEGEKFKLNGNDYTKIKAVKISCCRSINATLITDTNKKTFVQPLTEVEVDDQLQ